MPIKSLDTCEQFAVVAAGDQNLCVLSDGGLKERQRAGSELVGLEDANLIFTARGEVSRSSQKRYGEKSRLTSIHCAAC